jgi:hypothetical protein
MKEDYLMYMNYEDSLKLAESYKEDGNNEYLLPISVEMDMRYFYKE